MSEQKDSETPPPKPAKWAIITAHPSLPSKDEQVARARAWGVTESLLDKQDVSALVIDDARKVKKTTNWDGKLPKREAFLARLPHLKLDCGAIFFATPLCVSFGQAMALETINAIWSAGFRVYVHTSGALYAAGDDMSDFLKQRAQEANIAYAAKSRRKAKPESKR